ncbi:hypothetical protein [Streptomyces sp. NPDC005799]|uniref:alpha/beta hydrolase family protein n=1 Tax=Streptomyces sp. NPDC005799 TaxID=3154678 RepID=UPI00340CFAD1
MALRSTTRELIDEILAIEPVECVVSTPDSIPLDLQGHGHTGAVHDPVTGASFGVPDGLEVAGRLPSGCVLAAEGQRLVCLRCDDAIPAPSAAGRVMVLGRYVCVLHEDVVHVAAGQDCRSVREWRAVVPTDGLPLPVARVVAAPGGGLTWPQVGGRQGFFRLDVASGTLTAHLVPCAGPDCEAALSADGMYVAVWQRGTLRISVVATAQVLMEASGVLCPAVWDAEGCTWISRDWPHTMLGRWSPGGGRVQVESPWTLGRPVPSAVGVRTVATHPGVPLRGIWWADAGSPPAQDAALPYTAHAVPVPGGELRSLSYGSGCSRRGVAVLLRGGPYGEWTPVWDPMVELLLREGFVVHQLESPYTAAVQRRLSPAFRRGEFGFRDAELVAAAIHHLAGVGADEPLSGTLALVGHSYGAFLAARTAHRVRAPDLRLVTMNGPWCPAEMYRLAEGADTPAPGSLGEFVTRALAPDAERAVQRPPAHARWTVIHGDQDPIMPPSLVQAAARRDRPDALVRLAGEGHVPRHTRSVRRVLEAIAICIEE